MKAVIASVLLFLSLAVAVPIALPSAAEGTRDHGLPGMRKHADCRLDLTLRGDTAPVMTDTAGEIVPFDTAGVVTAEN